MIDDYLTELVRILNKKEESRHHDFDDPDYYGIRDVESLFSYINDHYKPILVKSSFNPIQEGHFWGCSWMGQGPKSPPP